ncbi:MAG: hypothetical protein NVSMB7_04850 [Chitinophagaceae bacterium]
MKKILIIIVAVCATFFALNSCKKTGGNINPLTDVNNLTVGSYLVRDSSISANLNTSSSASKIGIVVHQYPLGEAVDHILIYAEQGTSTDTAQWRLVKSVPYTANSKVALSVNPVELGTAFGVNPSAFTPGTLFTFFTRAVTKSGKTYDINNAGDNGGGGLITGPAYKSAFSFNAYVVCPFTGGMTGTYKVVRDDWQDWNPGDMVQVTDGPGTNQVNLSQVWPNPAYGTVIKPLLVNVDASSGAAIVPKVDFGSYNNIVTSAGSGSGYVFSCTGYITLNIDVIYGGGDQGGLSLILQKQ